MKKKIGTVVYIICDDQICFVKIGYVGNESFIVEDYKICYDEYQEFYFDEYNETWFTSLNKAKQYMRKVGYKYFLQRNYGDGYIECFTDIEDYKYAKEELEGKK